MILAILLSSLALAFALMRQEGEPTAGEGLQKDAEQVSDVEDHSVEASACQLDGQSCGGQCGVDSGCDRECVASSGLPCNCGDHEVPGSGVITCDAGPSIL